MNVLFVFYVPSGGVETLNRQRCKALKKYNINAHCLYYENRKKSINDHGTQTFVTNEDHEIKKILDEGDYSLIVIVSDFQALPRFRSLGYQGKMIIEIQGYGPKSTAKSALTDAIPLVTNYASGFLNPKTPHIVQLLDELYPHFQSLVSTIVLILISSPIKLYLLVISLTSHGLGESKITKIGESS